MQQVMVTIGPKSQVVIPKKVRDVVPAFRPGKKVIVRPLNEHSVIVEASSKDWVLETYGMHKKVWKGIDATAYIRSLREEWGKRAG